MDRSVPAGAVVLLDFIRDTEVSTTARSGYDIIFSKKQDSLPKPITSMTLLEVQKGQSTRWNGLVRSSASGGYQFMYKTLGGLIEELNLDIHQRFTPDLQDRLGYHLLKRRKYLEWAAGKISDETFAGHLAREWASFPVLDGPKKGRSYYAGDGLNKALVSTATMRAKLAEARAAIDGPVVIEDVPEEVPTVSEPIRKDIEKVVDRVDKPASKSKTNWLAAFVAALGALGTFVSSLHPAVQGAVILGMAIGAVLIWRERKDITQYVRSLTGAAE